jgi:hypothetical protein
MTRRVLWLGLLTLACGDPSAPTRTVPTLEFAGVVVFGIPTLPTTAIGDARSMLITGVVQTQGAGFTLFGALHADGQSLMLEIDAYDTKPGGFFKTQNYYRATVRDLAPGEYSLQVFHAIHDPAPGIRERVFNGTVRVQ